MLHILYPHGINWFHEAIARDVHEDLAVHHVPSTLLTPADLLHLPPSSPDAHDLLIVNLAECCHALGLGNFADTPRLAPLRNALSRFRTRTLLNVDCLHTDWFVHQLSAAAGLLTHILDLNMVPQTANPLVAGCPYSWLPECFTSRALDALIPHAPGRPLPWAVIGHKTPARCQLVNALMTHHSPKGFVFLPEVRPAKADSRDTLSPEALYRILRNTDFYPWTSHHAYPYHECLRALHALQNGAIPVKLCPTAHEHFPDLPWVYTDLAEFLDTLHISGAQRLFDDALAHVKNNGTLGQRLASLLAQPAGVPV